MSSTAIPAEVSELGPTAIGIQTAEGVILAAGMKTTGLLRASVLSCGCAERLEELLRVRLLRAKLSTDEAYDVEMKAKLEAYEAELKAKLEAVLKAELKAKLEAELEAKLEAYEAELKAKLEAYEAELKAKLEAELKAELEAKLEAYEALKAKLELSTEVPDEAELEALKAKVEAKVAEYSNMYRSYILREPGPGPRDIGLVLGGGGRHDILFARAKTWDKTWLYHFDTTFTSLQVPYKAVGPGSVVAQQSLEEACHESMTLQEATKQAYNILKQVMGEELSSSHVEAAMVTPDGVKFLEGEELKTILETLQA